MTRVLIRGGNLDMDTNRGRTVYGKTQEEDSPQQELMLPTPWPQTSLQNCETISLSFKPPSLCTHYGSPSKLIQMLGIFISEYIYLWSGKTKRLCTSRRSPVFTFPFHIKVINIENLNVFTCLNNAFLEIVKDIKIIFAQLP